MAYEPTDWKNREVERPRTFTLQNNDDGTITLIPAEGKVSEPGTPIMAVNMNKIENQLVYLDESQLTDGPNAIKYTGHLDDLTKTGFYYADGALISKGFPREVNDLHKVLIEVFNTTDGWLLQRFTWWSNTGPFIYQRGMYLGNWAEWKELPAGLNDTITSRSITEAATANAVKQLNDLKANKSSEDWRDLPLTGGVSGTILYYKNEVGDVRLSGTITSNVATDTTIATMPLGYRPRMGINNNLPFYTGGVANALKNTAVCVIYESGSIITRAPLSGTTYIDCTYRAQV